MRLLRDIIDTGEYCETAVFGLGSDLVDIGRSSYGIKTPVRRRAPRSVCLRPQDGRCSFFQRCSCSVYPSIMPSSQGEALWVVL